MDSRLRPFHISLPASDVEKTIYFYQVILRAERLRADWEGTKRASVHFKLFGNHLTFHIEKGFEARNIDCEVDGKRVPVPHFGFAISTSEFEDFEHHLEYLQKQGHSINIFRATYKRHLGKKQEQLTIFLLDPSGWGVEIKTFTQLSENDVA